MRLILKGCQGSSSRAIQSFPFNLALPHCYDDVSPFSETFRHSVRRGNDKITHRPDPLRFAFLKCSPWQNAALISASHSVLPVLRTLARPAVRVSRELAVPREFFRVEPFAGIERPLRTE